MPVTVRPISREAHSEHVSQRPGVSFLQVPEWADVKPEWGSRSLGWFEGGDLIGAALVLTRPIPRIKRWLAYVPEGPHLPWSLEPLRDEQFLAPMLDHLRQEGAFLAKIGPSVALRRWKSGTLKAHIGTDGVARLRDVTPDWEGREGHALVAALRGQGWTQRPDTGAGFGDVQPRYVLQIPLEDSENRRKSEVDLLAGFNQLWRRNIRRSDKLGVTVSRGDRDDLALFHPVYVETAARDGFVPRGLSYFEAMWDALNRQGGNAKMDIYLARWKDTVLAAATMITVGRHVWYSYGASANSGRSARPSNAIQWKMMRDALHSGAAVYDMRGMTDTLDPADPHFGLTQFKLGTGGDVVEYVGEWDFPLRPALAKAFDAYLRRDEFRSRAAGALPKARRRKRSKPSEVES